MAEAQAWCWRHPPAMGAAGRCIGRTDLAVDPRKAKRLAHRIRTTARRQGLPREVWASPLRRSRDVGRWLARWGWRLHIDARLAELDFGTWDGLPWSSIAWSEVQAWQDDLLYRAPGGGESLQQLARRAVAFAAEAKAEAEATSAPRLLVTHGGWINALLHLPPGCTHLPAAAWPAAPKHASLTRWPGV